MKNTLICLVALCAAVSVFADLADSPRRGRPKGMSKPSGGIVEKPYSGKVLRVQNMQGTIPADKIAALTQKVRWTTLLPVEVTAGEVKDTCLIDAANALVSSEAVGAGVLLVEDKKMPIVLTSPDSRWAVLNVAALSSDGPTPEKLFERFTKVYWCAVARALGVGNSCCLGCVLIPFTNLAELDRIGVLQPSPEPFNKMIDSAAAYGIRTLSIASYRTACQQGWAQQPTNDVQRAIWDEVHAMPTAPMKIEFDPKKGR
ncbi:MAG: hypothetical protein IKU71_01295 [Kiritimatiellae bacterium]|nr:hypothetical protein [Kiritimatiellia bacterium]